MSAAAIGATGARAAAARVSAARAAGVVVTVAGSRERITCGRASGGVARAASAVRDADRPEHVVSAACLGAAAVVRRKIATRAVMIATRICRSTVTGLATGPCGARAGTAHFACAARVRIITSHARVAGAQLAVAAIAYAAAGSVADTCTRATQSAIARAGRRTGRQCALAADTQCACCVTRTVAVSAASAGHARARGAGVGRGACGTAHLRARAGCGGSAAASHTRVAGAVAYAARAIRALATGAADAGGRAQAAGAARAIRIACATSDRRTGVRNATRDGSRDFLLLEQRGQTATAARQNY